MFSYRNDLLETEAKEPMGPNGNKSHTTWQTWQFLATGLLSLSIYSSDFHVQSKVCKYALHIDHLCFSQCLNIHLLVLYFCNLIKM